MPSKLARSIQLTIRGEALNVTTPLLVPSFSSKAVMDIGTVFSTLQPSITDTLLVSAYDLSYERIQLPQSPFAEALFVDSGGYEIAKDYEALHSLPVKLEAESTEKIRQAWNRACYRKFLNDYEPMTSTIVTAYDHPHERYSVSSQIDHALDVFREFPNLGREILIKPEVDGQSLIRLQSLLAEVDRFSQFDVIGITESELGRSPLERMENIARIRQAMEAVRVVKPLHIFGSLDPVCTPLYFLAGADIFDGLSWLRFSFGEEMTFYHKNRGPLAFGTEEGENRALARTYEANIHYLRELNRRLRRYLIDRDEGRLGRHHPFFVESLDNLRVRIPGVV